MSEENQKKPGLMARIGGKLMSNMKGFFSPSRGGAEIAGYLRGGLKDLQDVVVKPFPDTPGQHEELGMFGSPTPQMVTEGLTGRGTDSRTDKVAPIRPSAGADKMGERQEKVAEPQQPEVAAEMARMQGNTQSRSRGR